MPLNKYRELGDWQQKFIDAYAVSNAQKSLLVAAIGTGKSITALSAARNKITDGAVSKVIVISAQPLQEQWRQVGKELDLELAGSLSHLLTSHQQGAVITYQSLNNPNNLDLLKANAKDKSSLFIFDEVYRYLNKAEEISAEVTSLNKESKLLYLASSAIKNSEFDWQYEFGREFLFQSEIIQLPETKIEIVQFSPSLSLLDQFRSKILSLDDISWRQFEILISELLNSDGYEVELMKGTKDGGVDIVAVKDLKEAGLYKTLWQAKK